MKANTRGETGAELQLCCMNTCCSYCLAPGAQIPPWESAAMFYSEPDLEGAGTVPLP